MIWKLCETKTVEGYVSSLTVANLIYVMRKELDPEKIEEIICQMKLIFQLTDLNVTDMIRAAEMKWDDFEDAVQSVCIEYLKGKLSLDDAVSQVRSKTAIYMSE